MQKHDLVLHVEEWEDRAGFPPDFRCLEASFGLPFLHSYLPMPVLLWCVLMGRCKVTVRVVSSQVLLGARSLNLCLQFIFQMTRRSQEALASSCQCTAQMCPFSARTALTTSDGAARGLGGKFPSNEMELLI